MLLAIFVATVLIANICGTPISTALIGAAIGTLIYEVITKFKSPMFISSCGATASAVLGALTTTSGKYISVAVGGAIIFLVYLAFALLIKFGGKKYFDKVFPPIVVGAVTIVIGLNLAGFIPGYMGISADGVINYVPVLVALFTMGVTAVITHYCKGFFKTVGFLGGLICGFILAIIIETAGGYNFNIIYNLTHWEWFNPKDFAFMNWDTSFTLADFGRTVSLFLPVSICAALEHYSDHKVLGNIIGVDLTVDPGLDRTLIGDGLASAVGAIIGGQPNTSYGESIATIGFSRVASVWMTTIAAAVLGVMGFIAPITAFINAIPSAVFGGCAMILYGYIAASGLKTLINNKVDLENNKNLIVVSVILTVGVSGIYLFDASFAGVSLAMVLGVILNLGLVERKKKLD